MTTQDNATAPSPNPFQPERLHPAAHARFERMQRLRNTDLGPVFLAADLKAQDQLRSLKVLVDLVVLNGSIAIGRKTRDTLMTSLLALRPLEHKSVLRVYEVSTDRDELLISVQHVEGISLKTALYQHTFSVAEIVSVLIGVSSALESLHSLGFIPTGINAETTLVLRDATVKVDPIGASLLGSKTRDAYLLTNPLLLSPESTEQLGTRHDQYAVGTLGVELLFGKTLLPRNATGRARRVNALWSVLRLRLRGSLAPPPALLNLLDRLRSSNPAERPDTMKEAREALERIAGALQKEDSGFAVFFDRTASRSNARSSVESAPSKSEAAVDEIGLPPDPQEEEHLRNRSWWFLGLVAIYLGTVITLAAWWIGVL
jgi:serine/threonine protein kinase